MKHRTLLSALVGLIMLGCSSDPLTDGNAGEVANALSPLVDTLEGDGMTIYSVGAGQCWSGEGVCAQTEAQTGADEARIREALTAALEAAGYTGGIEVRTFDENPRRPQ